MTRFNWTVVRCMDGRLNVPISKYLARIGIVPPAYDLLSLPGGPRDLRNRQSDLSCALGFSITLHRVSNVLLIQHTDCSAYGGRIGCGGSEEADREFHITELRQAARVLAQAYPELSLHLVLAHIRCDGDVVFEDVPQE